jgi:hypothetical protein
LLAGIGLATLALAWTLPADAYAPGDVSTEAASDPVLAESPAESSITVGLEVSQTGAEQPTFAIRGNRTNPSVLGRFKVEATVARIPCPGDYRFEAGQENTENGNSITYSAQISLFNLESQPPGARCGVAPPARPGHLTVMMDVGNQEPFALSGRRRTGEPFNGTLSFTRFLECDRTYRLETAFDLADWTRTFDFDMRVIEIGISIPGRKATSERC